MINTEEFVQISDDDNVLESEEKGFQSLDTTKKVRELKNGYTRINHSKVIDTIVIDDENLSQGNNDSENNNIIEINDSDCIYNNSTKSHITLYDHIFKENKLLADFIEKCLDLEHSEGMQRIINRNLVRVYAGANENYKKSPEFQKVLRRAICSLEREPDRKFSHVKFLCETLKSQAKKRAKLITLATNLKESKPKPKLKRKYGDFAEKIIKRPKHDNVIDLDGYQKVEMVINLDEYQTDVIVLDESMEIDNEKENKWVNNKEIEQIHEQIGNEGVSGVPEATEKNTFLDETDRTDVIYDNIIKIDNSALGNEGVSSVKVPEATEKNGKGNNILEEVLSGVLHETNITDVLNENNIIKIENSEEDRFLVAQVEVSWEPSTDTSLPSTSIVTDIREVPVTFEPVAPMIDMQKIKVIEERIAYYKNMIALLDEEEVCDDSMASPYLRSEKMKATIVSLYKELCVITGQLPVKRREVRLQVREGHPSGPVRLLEEFINHNIGSDGAPPFPDFSDVVKCVVEGNEAQGLGWCKARIMREASALFTQCGRALQKQRQRREWRDLVSTVSTEAVDRDPADEDPQLLAKLEENRRLAQRKEKELIDRYATMKTRAPRTKLPDSTQLNLVSTQEHQVSTPEYLVSTQESLVSTQESLVSTQEILVSNQGNIVSTQEILVSTQNNLVSDQQILVPNQENLVPTQENLVPTQVYLVSTQDNLVSTPNILVPSQDNLVSTQEDLKPTQTIDHASNTPDKLNETENRTEITFIKAENNVNIKSENHDTELKDRGDTRMKDNVNSQNHFASTNGLHSHISKTSNHFISNLKEIVNSICHHVNSNNGESNLNNIVISNPHSVQEHEILEQGSVELYSKSHRDSVVQDTVEVKVKKEPIDIAAMLEELGDNYSACILDIEDPFLVIDISSDSSDED